MLRALLYLRLTSFQNWGKKNLRQLRQPKYIFYTTVGIAYFWFFFFRRIGAPRPPRTGAIVPLSPLLEHASPDDLQPALIVVGGLIIFLICALLAWVLPSEKPGLMFTETEVAFLFPAPVTRRSLVHFRLISAQLRMVFTALFFALITQRWGFLPGNTFTHAVGWWIVLSALHFHFMGAAFTVSRLIEGGVSVLRRRLAVAAVIGVLIAIALVSNWSGAPNLDEVPGQLFESFTIWLSKWLDTGVPHWLLWPFRAVITPFLSPDFGSFALALGPAVLVLIAQYFWVVNMETSFEEASVSLAEKQAARIAAMRAGKGLRFSATKPKARPAPFDLSRPGRPEFAFVWKNLLASRPYFTVKVFAIFAALIVVSTTLLRTIPPRSVSTPLLGVVIGLAAIVAFYTMLIGPQLARQDLRSDLMHADILKTYPIAGWQIVLGELLTPTVILTGIQWLAVLAACCAVNPRPMHLAWITPGVRTGLGLGLMVLIPPLCLLQLLVPNAAALVFPAWAQNTRGRPGGVDVIGQRLVFVFGQLITFLVALLPAGLAAVAAFFCTEGLFVLLDAVWKGAAQSATGPAVFASALAVMAVFVGEIWLGIWWLGRRFEKLDIAAEVRT